MELLRIDKRLLSTTLAVGVLVLGACSAEESNYPEPNDNDTVCADVLVAGALSGTLTVTRDKLSSKLQKETGNPEAGAQFDPLTTSWRLSKTLKKNDPKGSQGSEQLIAGERFRLCLDTDGNISSVEITKNLS